MAHIQKIVTYDLPDEYEMEGLGAGADPSSPVTKKRKLTTTREYDGPETLLLWIYKTNDVSEFGDPANKVGTIHDCWDKDEPAGRPVPADCEEVELHADSDENMIKIGLLHSGFAEPGKIYEIAVGPSADFNTIMLDPSDPRKVFSEDDITDDWTKPLVFRGDTELKVAYDGQRFRGLDDDNIRKTRNSKLKASDSRVASDMPAALKKEWETYRQKLRDMPADWLKTPNIYVQWPDTPDGEEPWAELVREGHADLIKIADRKPGSYAEGGDDDAIKQLEPITGLDEYTD